jgi:hypothetical protein
VINSKITFALRQKDSRYLRRLNAALHRIERECLIMNMFTKTKIEKHFDMGNKVAIYLRLKHEIQNG